MHMNAPPGKKPQRRAGVLHDSTTFSVRKPRSKGRVMLAPRGYSVLRIMLAAAAGRLRLQVQGLADMASVEANWDKALNSEAILRREIARLVAPDSPAQARLPPSGGENRGPVDQFRDARVVMVGDSMMRYQYLALAFWLAHGVQPAAGFHSTRQHSNGRVSQHPDRESICNESK